MLTMLQNWKGPVEINGSRYENVTQAILNAKLSDSSQIDIKLLQSEKRVSKRSEMNVSDDIQQYRISVKQYMTKKASPDFDFMQKWNNNVPMPFMTMIGTVEKETRGMVYMKLHADIYAPIIQTCMMCGRPITNKISQYFGVGPICGGHNYVNPFNSEEELKEAVGEYRKKLQKITWEGWIIKSAITCKEEVDAVN